MNFTTIEELVRNADKIGFPYKNYATIKKLVDSGEIKCLPHKKGDQYRIPMIEIERYINSWNWNLEDAEGDGRAKEIRLRR